MDSQVRRTCSVVAAVVAVAAVPEMGMAMEPETD